MPDPDLDAIQARMEPDVVNSLTPTMKYIEASDHRRALLALARSQAARIAELEGAIRSHLDQFRDSEGHKDESELREVVGR